MDINKLLNRKMEQTEIVLKINPEDSTMETNCKGTNIDILTLLSFGTIKILQKMDMPIDVFCSLLKDGSKFNNLSPEEQRKQIVMMQLLLNSLKK